MYATFSFRLSSGSRSFNTIAQFTFIETCAIVMSASHAETPIAIFLMRSPPFYVSRSPPKQAVDRETDDPDQQHPSHHKVISLPRISRINDQVAKAGIDRDHLGSDEDEPGHAERNAKRDEDRRQRRGNDHLCHQA